MIFDFMKKFKRGGFYLPVFSIFFYQVRDSNWSNSSFFAWLLRLEFTIWWDISLATSDRFVWYSVFISIRKLINFSVKHLTAWRFAVTKSTFTSTLCSNCSNRFVSIIFTSLFYNLPVSFYHGNINLSKQKPTDQSNWSVG